MLIILVKLLGNSLDLIFEAADEDIKISDIDFEVNEPNNSYDDSDSGSSVDDLGGINTNSVNVDLDSPGAFDINAERKKPFCLNI